LKASSATSAKAVMATRPRTGQSSALPTPTSPESFALSGPSDLPDPTFHAYRQDLADITLAGRVIASHYAEPLERVLSSAAELRASPSLKSDVLAKLSCGEPFWMLDNSLGWAWGYAGEERRVGYLVSDAVTAP
jgi:hypothetical protein